MISIYADTKNSINKLVLKTVELMNKENEQNHLNSKIHLTGLMIINKKLILHFIEGEY